MPSSSIAQRNYIFYLRGKYKSKKNTPKDQEWIWNDDWLSIKESSFRSEVKAWIDPEGNYLPFIRIKNHDDMLPLGLRYGDALRKGWIRLYKTPDRIHITCHTFDAKELKCCMKIFNQVDELKTLPIVIATGSKIINYNPLFRESGFMKPYKRFFEDSSVVLSTMASNWYIHFFKKHAEGEKIISSGVIKRGGDELAYAIKKGIGYDASQIETDYDTGEYVHREGAIVFSPFDKPDMDNLRGISVWKRDIEIATGFLISVEEGKKLCKYNTDRAMVKKAFYYGGEEDEDI